MLEKEPPGKSPKGVNEGVKAACAGACSSTESAKRVQVEVRVMSVLLGGQSMSWLCGIGRIARGKHAGQRMLQGYIVVFGIEWISRFTP
jgi:hypothetical protein